MNHTNHEHATDNDTNRLRDEFNNKLYNFIFCSNLNGYSSVKCSTLSSSNKTVPDSLSDELHHVDIPTHADYFHTQVFDLLTAILANT